MDDSTDDRSQNIESDIDSGIPPLLPPDQMPPVTDQVTLYRTWRALMGELGFARPQLWVLHLRTDGRLLGTITIEDVPKRLGPEEARQLVAMLRETGAGGDAGFAFLYARPGHGPRTTDDLSWATGLTWACREAGLPVWPVHLADDRQVSVVAPDDLCDAG